MKRLRTPDIVEAVALAWGIPAGSVYKHGMAYGCRDAVQARMAAMFLARRYTRLSYPLIARRLGLADHCSAHRAVRVMPGRIAEDAILRFRVASAIGHLVARGFLIDPDDAPGKDRPPAAPDCEARP